MTALAYHPRPGESGKADRKESRRTEDIPAATLAHETGRHGVRRYEFIDHRGAGCSDGGTGWFFSCRTKSWDEAYLVRHAEPEFDTYFAFENPQYRPGRPMSEEAKARLLRRRRNHARSGPDSSVRTRTAPETPSDPSGTARGPVTRSFGGETA